MSLGRCASCGRHIRTSECPFCAGIGAGRGLLLAMAVGACDGPSAEPVVASEPAATSQPPATREPSAEEIDRKRPIYGLPPTKDVDGDGYRNNDCGPDDAAIHPGAAERADDKIDSNCDGKDNP